MEPRRRSHPFGAPGRDPGRGEGGDRVWSVADLNEAARRRLEEDFARVLVEGEVSRPSVSDRGHVYFTLKDETAQLACVCWASTARRLAGRVEHGARLRVAGRLTVYPAGGRYQLVVETVEDAGRGDLERRFQEAKRRYEELGWFAPDSKREPPFLPERIGLVTSAQGAALRDFLRTLQLRFPRAAVLLAPCRVQGEGAADEIARALERLDARPDVEVIVLTRGGGSLEDLWAFNEAAVVEAIHAAVTPVVSAVGHETDFTLADFVADRRAATPTAAAELVVPVLAELSALLTRSARLLRRELLRRLEASRHRLALAAGSWSLREPSRIAERARQQLDESAARLRGGLRARLERGRRAVERCEAALPRHRPEHRIALERERLSALGALLLGAPGRRLRRETARLDAVGRALEALSPLAVLGRGYSITRTPEGRVLRDAEEAPEGAEIETLLGRGRLRSRVLPAPEEPGSAPDRPRSP